MCGRIERYTESNAPHWTTLHGRRVPLLLAGPSGDLLRVPGTRLSTVQNITEACIKPPPDAYVRTAIEAAHSRTDFRVCYFPSTFMTRPSGWGPRVPAVKPPPSYELGINFFPMSPHQVSPCAEYQSTVRCSPSSNPIF